MLQIEAWRPGVTRTPARAISPLVPDGAMSYFCLDGVSYHRHLITIVYDQTGQRYGRGAGLTVIVDGKTAVSTPAMKHLMIALADGTIDATATDVRPASAPDTNGAAMQPLSDLSRSTGRRSKPK